MSRRPSLAQLLAEVYAPNDNVRKRLTSTTDLTERSDASPKDILSAENGLYELISSLTEKRVLADGITPWPQWLSGPPAVERLAGALLGFFWPVVNAESETVVLDFTSMGTTTASVAYKNDGTTGNGTWSLVNN